MVVTKDGISLESISITSVMDSIKNFFNSQENNSKWTSSIVEGSEGITFIRFISNIFSNISYRLITARRENFISTANLVSGNIGISVNLGYSVFRGNNQKRIITFNPTVDEVIIPLSVIGTYNSDYDIINLTDLTLKPNIQQDIYTVIGKVKTLTFTAGTSNVKMMQLYTEGISEDFLLYMSGKEFPLPTTNAIRELSNDYYLVRTNPYKSVDIIYLNDNPVGEYKYGSENIFTIKYIELADVPTINYTSEMFTYGSLINTKIIELYQPFETIENIKIKAPLAHETQNLIRAKEDFPKRLVEISQNVIKATYKIITPTYSSVTYLKNDNTILTSSEKTHIYEVFDKEEFLGTPSPDIVHPKLENMNLDILIKRTDKIKNIADIDVDISNILSTSYKDVLAQTVNTYDIETMLNDLSYVKYARVNFHIDERENNTIYNSGNLISVDNINYKASYITGMSGTTEPLWNIPVGDFLPIKPFNENHDISYNIKVVAGIPLKGSNYFILAGNKTSYFTNTDTINAIYDSNSDEYSVNTVEYISGDDTTKITTNQYLLSQPYTSITKTIRVDYETTDNKVVWATYKRLNVLSITEWHASKEYKTGDFVYSTSHPNFMFKCIDLKKLSASTQPSFTNTVIGDFVYDGELIWVCKILTNINPIRANSTNYKIGESVRLSGGNYSYECIGYRGKTSSSVVIFELPEYNILSQSTNYFVIDGDYTDFFKATDTLRLYRDGGIDSYSVNAVEYISGNNTTKITTNQTLLSYTYTKVRKQNIGTIDGEIVWEIVPDDTNVTYNWNSYNNFNYNLTIK